MNAHVHAHIVKAHMVIDSFHFSLSNFPEGRGVEGLGTRLTLMVVSFNRRKPSIRFCIKLASVYYIKFLLHQVSTTAKIVSQDFCMYVVSKYCSLVMSASLPFIMLPNS